jgi:hypothetical protein
MSTQLTNLLALSSLTDPVPEQPSSANRSVARTRKNIIRHDQNPKDEKKQTINWISLDQSIV